MLLRIAVACACIVPVLTAADTTPRHQFFQITLDKSISAPVSGRLLLFVMPGKDGKDDLEISEFSGEARGYVAAEEVRDVKPGETIEMDVDELAYPASFSTISAGDYRAQAVLDVHHTFNYGGREEGDIQSDIVPLAGFTAGAGVEPHLTLSKIIPARPAPPLPTGVEKQEFQSPVLTAFYHRPIFVRALVVLPPNYAASPANKRFPACYFTHGFGGNLAYLTRSAQQFSADMASGKIPPMFWILLDESLPTGTHEFADSANNGPWGQALTTEFIPYLEKHYKLDRRAGARFLNGHSSGGWATLWLQVAYPRVFGGTWSTSPDPSDFHNWSGIDLYAPHANVYHKPDGSAYPIVRMNGKVVATVEQFAHLEEVLGPIGGQFASFEWVFSPKDIDGRPMQMFHRGTGDVNPDVVEAWKRYDIVNKLESEWPRTGPYLTGKIHVFVGTADTFYLDGAAHLLDAELQKLNAHATLTFLDGRSHFDVYKVGDDKRGLFYDIAKQMYAKWQAGENRK